MNNNKKFAKWFIRIMAVLLALAMILPLFSSVFAQGEDGQKANVTETKQLLPFYVYIILGLILIIVAIVLAKKDKNRKPDPLEDKKLLKDYRKTKRQ